MRARIATTWTVTAALLVGLWAADWAAGNGGPFVVKAPNGDPAAKGVLARLDPTLKPARETRLRVVKEDLTVQFNHPRYYGDTAIQPPLAEVTAAYTIENPTDEEVQVDFGFPILRGIYMRRGMVDTPDVRVTADKEYLQAAVISNSLIYGMIRDRSRETIEKGIAADAELARLVQAVRDALGIVPGEPGDEPMPRVLTAPSVPTPPGAPQAQQAVPPRLKKTPTPEAAARARLALQSHLTAKLKWNDRDAALLVEYASLNFGRSLHWPRDRWDTSAGWSMRGEKANELLRANLGPLAAIGEQKATQFFAQLASKFDKDLAATYESLFAAWGGEVRERSVDLASGQVRPRELASVPAPPETPESRFDARSDPTVYARLDYIDPNINLPPEQKASCETVLRNLPVTFTFAPMNLLHYQVKFPAKQTRLVTITYRQYAYADTANPASYQLAYVLHPASLWQEFGPINLTVRVPKGVACKASAAVEKAGQQEVPEPYGTEKVAMDVYTATLTDAKQKQGELFVGLDRAVWDQQASAAAKKAAEEAKKREEEAKKPEEEAKKNTPQGAPVFSADLDIPYPQRGFSPQATRK
jgi:hypothetical protein